MWCWVYAVVHRTRRMHKVTAREEIGTTHNAFLQLQIQFQFVQTPISQATHYKSLIIKCPSSIFLLRN